MLYSCISDIEIDIISRRNKDIQVRKTKDGDPILEVTRRKYLNLMRETFDVDGVDLDEEGYKLLVDTYLETEGFTNISLKLLITAIKFVQEGKTIEENVEDLEDMAVQLSKEEKGVKAKTEKNSIIKIKSSLIRYIFLVNKTKDRYGV